MRRIVVRNFGPIEQAEVELKRVNIIIGPQSAGKSCLLKVACYCTWGRETHTDCTIGRFAEG